MKFKTLNSNKEYSVIALNENFEINGKGDHKFWDNAKVLTDFSSPWDAKFIDPMVFKALWSKDYLYCLFSVKDSNVYVNMNDNTINSINVSDRVELFFKANEELNPYYCLEIDPSPRIMDFMARPNRQFNFDWKWPINDIEVKSNIKNSYFSVEIKLSINSLLALGLLKNGKIETGIYRAKYDLKNHTEWQPTWITWVNPNTKKPDFHIASSFGLLILEGY